MKSDPISDVDEVTPDEDSVSQTSSRRERLNSNHGKSSSSLVTMSSRSSHSQQSSRSEEIKLAIELEAMKCCNACEEKKRNLQRQIEEEEEGLARWKSKSGCSANSKRMS